MSLTDCEAPVAHSDSDYGELVAEHEDRPRLTIRTRQGPLNKAKNANPTSARVYAHGMPQISSEEYDTAADLA